MLIANHKDNITITQELDTVTTSGYGVIKPEYWRAIRDNMSTGMLFIDEHNNVSRISKEKLNNGKCTSISEVDALQSQQSLWHNEDTICDTVGFDYSIINLGDSTNDPNNYEDGASLFQLSSVKFDVWPYAADHSYRVQNELLYFIK